MYSVSDETRKPIFEGVQGENEAREIQFDVTAWVEELGEGVCTATAKRPTDTTPYPVTVTRSGNVVTWKPNSTDTSIEGIGAFQLAFSINDVVAKTRIWNTKIAPSLVGAGDPPDPYDDWIQDLRGIAAETLTYSQNAENSADDAETEKFEAEAWAKGTKNGTPVSSPDAQYQNNAKYWAEQSLANQYGAFIVKSASGDIASFTDGADNVPMKSLNVTITPKQSGSGDPSPSNVRPISGTSTANVFVMGKNMLDTSAYHDSSKTTNGITFTINADGTIKATGTATATASFLAVYDDQKLPLGNYYVAGCPNGGGSSTYRMNVSSWAGYSSIYESGSGAAWNHGTDERIRVTLVVYAGNTVDIVFKPIISKTPVTYADYVPYTGHTTPVPLGQTVYGGEVNPISGELTISMAMVDLGTLTWFKDNTRSIFHTYINDRKVQTSVSDPINIIIENYRFGAKHNGASNLKAILPNDSFGITYDGNSGVYIRDDAYTTVADFKTAMNGVKMVYELATPTTVQLIPTQVATLLGTNNVWSDAGSVAVEYRADPTLAYAELEALILENI